LGFYTRRALLFEAIDAELDIKASQRKFCVAAVNELGLVRNGQWRAYMSAREKSCGAVVFRKNSELEYLLLHYGAGHWDYVKGQVEPNETEKDTVVRELKEETSIEDAHFIEGFREEIGYFYRREGKTILKKVVFFLLEAKKSEVRLSYEHIGYEWLTFQKAMERLTFSNAKKVLTKAQGFLKDQGIEH
jgi:8-oxo-dGTP pyrophosphatase MutT (NUDIX family)